MPGTLPTNGTFVGDAIVPAALCHRPDVADCPVDRR
jgi:hypothetical protein